MRFSVEREDLDRWCKQVLETDKLHTSRLSSVFKFQAFFFYSMGNRIDSIRKAVHDIDQEVIQSPGMKADTQFESLPLKGLWKKHVYDLAWEAVNLKSEFADEMSYFGVRLRKLFKEHEGQSFDSIRNEVIDLAINAMPNREKAGALTGEWIIYSRTNGNRLILTFAGHREGATRKGDMNIYRRVLSCQTEFPDLALPQFQDMPEGTESTKPDADRKLPTKRQTT